VEKRNVGKSGLRVSAVGLGCNNFGWTLDEEQSRKIIHTALDLGITLFDTAPVYGANGGESEEILGRALGNRRKDAVVVTKFGVPLDRMGRFNTSRAAIMEEIDASLKRLNTDYIDIYMLHWPDPTTPLQETLRALDDIITAGKARYIGCSNLSAWRLVESKWISRTERLHDFIVTQNEYSLAQREADTSLLPALEEYGVALMPYAPLANGLLTGKYSAAAPAPEDSRLGKNMWNLANRYLTEDKLQLAESLGRFAADRGHTLLELAISWLLSKPLVCSVIGGATKPEQVATNVAAGTGWRLGPEELVEVDRICRESRRDHRN
jgi:aryl-alcohol dehydrogenase-like predicted oxidoreductase